MLWEPVLDEAGSGGWRGRASRRDPFAPLAEELDREQRYPGSTYSPSWTPLTDVRPHRVRRAGAGDDHHRRHHRRSVRACSSTGHPGRTNWERCRAAGRHREQKRTLLGDLLRGKAISFALTEVGAGSDAAAIRTTAEREGDGDRAARRSTSATGRSTTTWCSPRPTWPPAPGITAPGAEGHRRRGDRPVRRQMGYAGLTSNLKLDTWVPESAILGELGGLRLALQTLDVGRVTWFTRPGLNASSPSPARPAAAPVRQVAAGVPGHRSTADVGLN